jgi:anti-anti-sigma factor
MVHVGSSFSAVPDRSPAPRAVPGAGPAKAGGATVIRLCGEHGISNDGVLCLTLARAIASGGTALVLDMSEVDLVAVSTLRVIARAGELLRQRSRSLTVQFPSARVRRVIDTCGLHDLLGPGPGSAGGATARALGPRAAVRAAERSGAERETSVQSPDRAGAHLDRATALGTQIASADRSVATAPTGTAGGEVMSGSAR